MNKVKRAGYEITLTVSDDGRWPEIAAKNLEQHVSVELPSGLRVEKFKAAKPKLKVEVVVVDWKDTEGLIYGFRQALKRLCIVMIDHPDLVGTDSFGFILSNRRLTKAELKDECMDADGGIPFQIKGVDFLVEVG